MILSRFSRVAAAAAVLSGPASALAQLSEPQVLLVYDSGINDSVLVAEHYAGSAKVPGGVGGVAGAHPGVDVFDLASVAGAGGPGATITYQDFITRFRDPIRTHLAQDDLAERIRCIVLAKGIPHRIADTDAGNVGDAPANAGAEFTDRDATYASVDSELTLLWQDLSQGENGGAADSKADGMIVNPYHESNAGIDGFSTRTIRSAKFFVAAPGSVTGQIWQSSQGLPASRLTPGDIYLVCRLDGHTVADVDAMIDRAQHLVVNTSTAAMILDESNHGGSNPELDDDGPPVLNAGNDFEQARDALLADGRFDPADVRYNNDNNAAGFSVGPLLSFDGEGLLITDPVLLLAHEGSNHAGTIPGAGPGPDPSAATLYAESFNYAPGAIFNTIESFNGRDFNGLGGNPSVPQQQASDFIGAGGTFAIGYVFEPFSMTLADNRYLVENFILGDLTWAEAAYTALPVLSWQAVVVGDPLARVLRTSDDVNGDGRVTLDDLYAWQANPTDINRDGTADASDSALIEAAIRGPEAGAAAATQR